jgi:shikimate kinase
MKKLAFIGMMGSGKTTISQKIAGDLSLKYYSIDEEIEKHHQMKTSEIFEVHGEHYFREEETNMVKQLSHLDNVVIDCGGGLILNPENIRVLKENNFEIIFLNRELEDILRDIDYETRPLLKDNHDQVYKIYNERIDLYFKYADIIINNTGSLKTKYSQILYELKHGKPITSKNSACCSVAI